MNRPQQEKDAYFIAKLFKFFLYSKNLRRLLFSIKKVQCKNGQLDKSIY